MFSCYWKEIKLFPKYLLIVTLISSFFPRGIFFHSISFQRFIENGKYALIITIHLWLMMWLVITFKSMDGVSYCLILKLNSQHSIDYFLPNMENNIVKHIEHWHEKVTYQTFLETFSFDLVYGKKLIFSQNIYLLSPLFNSNFSQGIFYHEISNQGFIANG